MSNVKKCYNCKETKDISLFSKNARKPDGLSCECKQCCSIYAREYRKNNKEKIAQANVAYVERNNEKISAYKKQWRIDNSARMKELTAQWKKENAASVRSASSERKARKIRATSTWANKDYIDGIYEVAVLFSRAGLKMHVDHIVPLKSKKVCGLHNEHNLRVLPAVENLAKNNHHWPDMW